MKKTKLPKPEDFAFSVGKIRSLETHLIRESILKEMLDMQPIEEAFKMWAQVKGYPEDILNIKEPGDIDEILIKQKEMLKLLISFLIKDQRYFDVIKLSFDDPAAAYKQAVILENEFLKNYIRIKIDFINIKMLFRQNKPPEVILSTYKNTPYNRIVSEGLEYFQRENSFARLEKLMDDFLIDFLKAQKYNAFGPEPVLAYYLAKENEFKMLKLIFEGRLLGLERDVILDRLNTAYV